MGTNFIKIYEDLEKDRWFFTVWVALPDKVRNIIKDNLEPLLPYCTWLSTMTGNHSKDVPHISLRYLGFSDELEHEEVKKDKVLFEKAIAGVKDLEIELKDITLWEKKVNDKLVVANPDWKITKKQTFIDIHKALLTVPNYYLFESLEGDNYNPHISLGSVDLSNSENYKFVKEYLRNKEFEVVKLKLNDFALNLTSPKYTEVIPLKV